MTKPKYFIPALWFILPILLMLSSCGKDSVPPTDNASVPPVSKSSATPSTEKLILTTEEHFGPFNYIDPKTKKMMGIAIEIVDELMKRAQVDYQVQVMPWARAYKQALETPNVCAFTTYKTPERIPLFKWVGPLLVAKWSLYALSDSKIVINSIDEAKKYTIGGYLADAATEYLERQGFVLDKVADSNLNPKKLQSGRIQLWVAGDPVGPFMANLLGITNIKSIYTFYKVEMGISCNKSISDELIAKLQATLNSLEQDGIAEKIRNKYSTSLPAKEIVVAVPTEGAPLVEVVNGELKGIIGDVSKILFTKMGYTYKLEKYPFPRLYAMLQEGTVDVALRVLASEKRRQLAWYSDPIVTEYQTIVVKKGKAFPFAKISDLNGKTIGVIRGFIYPTMDGRNEIRLEAGIDNAMNARKLLADRVDAIVVNSIFGLESLKKDGFLDKVEILPNAAAPVPLGIGLATGKFSDDEHREINQIIHEILEAPQWIEILKINGVSQWKNDYPLVKKE